MPIHLFSDFSECNDPIENSNGTETSIVVSSKKLWAYGQCPDVNECDLKLHDCHPNATCTNLDPGTFACNCNKGFVGDGHQTVYGLNEHNVVMDHSLVEKQMELQRSLMELNASKTNLLRGCHRTCFEDCVHGKCSQVNHCSRIKTFHMLCK